MIRSEKSDLVQIQNLSLLRASPDQHLGELDEVGVAEAAAAAPALRVIVGAAVPVVTTRRVALTGEARVIGSLTLASTGPVT